MHLLLLLLSALITLTVAPPTIIWPTYPAPEITTPSWVPPNYPHHPWSIITDHLVTSSSPKTTAQTLVELPASNPAGNHTLHIFKSILEITTQIPHTHPWHQSLATLLLEIKSQPPPPPEIRQIFQNSTIYRNQYAIKNFTWSDLPTFRMLESNIYMEKNRLSRQNREQWSGTEEMFTPSEWLSFNHFIALLVSKNIPSRAVSLNLARTGLIVLSSTLEQTHLDKDFLEDNVPSAAIWILTAGTWMKEYKRDELVIMYGPFDRQEQKVAMKREWELWSKKFWEVSGRMDLSVETRQWALRAAYHIGWSGGGL